MPMLNDVQSRLNATEMLRVAQPSNVAEVRSVVNDAALRGEPVCPAGSLHSMGGQQFAGGGVSLSSSSLTSIGPLQRDPSGQSGIVQVQAGVTWPMLVRWLRDADSDGGQPLSIIQKQTGADELTLGGAVSSNIHGRVLGRKPIVDDIEAFCMTLSDGNRVRCSREDNPELYRLAVGGYGLFGFIDSIDLKLEKRSKVVRRVEELSLEEVIPALEAHTRAGATFGDFQYVTDEASTAFMARGIMSVYLPLESEGEIPVGQLGLSAEDWMRLYGLAHTDKARAYAEYAGHYLQTDGQVYWSDEHQFSPYLPEAGDLLARQLGWSNFASLMISEIYVPRDRFTHFMAEARRSAQETGANVVYGTVRLIEAEDETFLRWAKRDFACIIFNLLVEHSLEGIDRGQAQFQSLIDCALNEGGCYYLTYHRWARPDQIERAYPEFREFLDLKDQYDAYGVFTSEWHRHYRQMFGRL